MQYSILFILTACQVNEGYKFRLKTNKISSFSLAELMIDDYHNVQAKKVPTKLINSRAIHMASCLVEHEQIPAVLRPPDVSIHRPVEVKVKGARNCSLLRWYR